MPEPGKAEETLDRSGPFTDLALTLPLFVGYHLGVVFLPYRNAADWVTGELQRLADDSMLQYGLLTVAIGAAYVVPLLLAGRGKHIGWQRFAWMGGEGIVYAVGMRIVAGLLAARLFEWALPSARGAGLLKTAPALSSAVERASEALDLGSRLTGAIMSLGAGFYEEVAFRRRRALALSLQHYPGNSEVHGAAHLGWHRRSGLQRLAPLRFHGRSLRSEDLLISDTVRPCIHSDLPIPRPRPGCLDPCALRPLGLGWVGKSCRG
jgi:hypothetical protein